MDDRSIKSARVGFVAPSQTFKSCRYRPARRCYFARPCKRVPKLGTMSVLGQKRTFAVQKGMSTLPSKVDICSALADVRSLNSTRMAARLRAGAWPLWVVNSAYERCMQIKKHDKS